MTSAFVRDLPQVGQYLGRDSAGANYRGNAMYMGDPDGPMRFIKSLGMEVPTYIDPRDDLRSQYKAAGAHKSVDYHIPPNRRGPYKPNQLADYDPSAHYPIITDTGNVRCGGLRSDGQICQKSAMNRTGFCSNHGGALHPADKLFAADRGIMPSTPEKLDRHQKVEMGIIPVSELTNEEIARQQIKLDNGTFSNTTRALSARITNAMRQEFFSRADTFVRENVLDMLTEMRNIAMSQVSEDKDKIQAATWLIERAMGKTPDVLITNKTDTPFENMMGDILGGSREEYRQNKGVDNSGHTVIEGEIDNGPAFLDEEDESECDGEAVGSTHCIVDSEGSDETDPDDGITDRNGTPGQDQETRDAVAIAAQRKARKNAINKARNRRFAAKANGLTTIDNLPYLVEFKTVKLKSGTVTRMKLISPDDQKMR